jgi:uncharacterized membrane protein
MSDESAPPSGEARSRRWSWLNVLLVVSLALNLLVAAAATARYFHQPPRERMAGLSYLQLIPRRFLSEVGHERRKELTEGLRAYRERYRLGNQDARKLAVAVADALAAAPYDEARLRAAIDDFNRNGTTVLGLGAEAALAFMRELTDEERLALARHIRERAESGRRR